jgi:undecaprenyl-diphosphatase
VALVVAVGSMILLDAWLVGQAQELPSWLRETFEWITWFGTADWFLWPTGILLFLLALSPLDRLSRFHRGVIAAIFVRAGFIFLAIGVPVLLVAVVKRLIGRARPYVRETVDPFSYVPFEWQEPYASLPSGHATNAFAAAIAIGALWPKARLPMWIFAVVIAASRIIVTAHYPSDVIAGAVIGTTCAILVRGWFAARRLGFAVGSDVTVHRMPGPSWGRTKAVARRLLGH